MENTVHFVLQGKGGVGKSLVSSMLAQYFINKGFSPVCADTDPVNSSFHQIKGLRVSLVPIAENGVIIQRLFDDLFESIINSQQPFVIDNGASTFLPIIKYLKDNNALNILDESNKKTYIHTIITAGQAKNDTINGLEYLLNIIEQSQAKIVLWQNEFWGTPTIDGQSLNHSSLILNNLNKIDGIVKIIERNNDAFTTDLRRMSEDHLTLEEVKSNEAFRLFSKSRIFKVFNDVFGELDQAFGEKNVSH